MKAKTKPSPAPVTESDPLKVSPDSFDAGVNYVERYQRTLEILIAAKLIYPDQIQKAWEIADWG